VSIDELRGLVHGKSDDDTVELFVPGDLGPVASVTSVMLGVPGLVIRKADGQTQVRVVIRKLRHALGLLTRAA
jgi:hypothetical protein